MQKTTRLVVVALVSALAGSGAVVNHLNAPLDGLTDLAALDQLNDACTATPTFAVCTGLTHINENWLGAMPEVPMLRLEDAVATAAIGMGWAPPAPTSATPPAAAADRTLVSGL